LFSAIGILLASISAQPGLGLGIGYLDGAAGVELRAELGLTGEVFQLKLAAPLRGLFLPDEGLSFRSSDWDELGDYSALLESLRVGDARLGLRGGRLLLTAGHGTVVDDYRAGGHPDHPAAGLSGHWRSKRYSGLIAMDRISDPGLIFGTLRVALKNLEETSVWVPSSAITIAADPRPAAPQSRGLDGRIAIDLESLWRFSGYQVGLYTDGVMGLGPQWAYRSRLHGGLMANWQEGKWLVGLRAEGRRSGDGLPAGPYDNLYALFRYEEGFVRPAASDALGFGLSLKLQQRALGDLTLRFASDPHGDEAMQRIETMLRATVDKKAAVYLAAGTWETGREPPSWYAQGEGRMALGSGLAGWLRLRRMRRQIDGNERAVVDLLVGLSAAISVRAQ